ncbi:hypothetical protein NSERUTF1_6588 [Nocardia seriolae]|nr:hypothetical protein NSERUTF1_6588 [Nocardia seriolae]
MPPGNKLSPLGTHSARRDPRNRVLYRAVRIRLCGNPDSNGLLASRQVSTLTRNCSAERHLGRNCQRDGRRRP